LNRYIFALKEVIMNTKNEQPFFARFLEGQEFPQVKTNVKAGNTTKFPSDTDEAITNKYPSDGDDYLPGDNG